VTAGVPEIRGVEFLDGRLDPWADEELLGLALSPSWTASGEFRRWATRLSPVLFGYTYLSGHLVSPDTGWIMSVAEHHLALHEVGRRWIRPGRHRHAIIAPRGAAKSTFSSLVLPLWAVAHGHRRFAALFGDTSGAIGIHFQNLRDELATNALLLHDFPELAPVRGRNTAKQVVTEGGGAFAARGIEEGAAGLKIGALRPDVIIADDLEPFGDRYSPALRDKRLGIWRHGVLPMATEAAVLMAGTVVMYGSIMHDLVLAANGAAPAPWIAEDGIRPLHFPAIAVDEVTGAERSFWERRWPLAELRAMRGTQDYALNYDGRPALPSGGHWTEDAFVVPAEPVAVEDRVISIDTAVSGESMNRRHDFTAVSVVGRAVGRPDVAVVEYCHGRRVNGAELLAWIHELCEAADGGIREVIIETNQGGDLWRQVLSPLPSAVRLTTYAATVGKDKRTLKLHDRYVRGQVIHQYHLPALQDALVRWPKVEHDDLIDATSAGVEYVLSRA